MIGGKKKKKKLNEDAQNHLKFSSKVDCVHADQLVLNDFFAFGLNFYAAHSKQIT